MITHITKSDMSANGLDLNRSLRRIVQATLTREYKKDPVNYVAYAHDNLLKRYGYSGPNQFGKMVNGSENIKQPDGSVKQVVNLRLKKYLREDSGEIIEFYGYYTAYFHLHTYEQIQAGEPSIEFLGGSF